MTLVRSIVILFVSLIFSALLWAYVRLSASYESDVDLPVKLTAPKGYALASGLPARLHSRIRGAGWQIMLMNFTGNADYAIDLSDRAVPAGSLLLHGDEIANAAVLPSEVRVVKVEPDSLHLEFSKAVQREVPIMPVIDVKPAKGFVLGMTTITPAHVTVTGAQSILDSLHSIPTSAIEAIGAREPIDRVVTIADSLENFVKVISAPKINIHVAVEPVGERTLAMVPVAIDALPPDYELILIPNAVSVTLRAGVDELAKLSAQSIHARITYEPQVFDTAHSIAPHVEVPKDITYLSCEPKTLRFIIRKRSDNAAP